MGLLNTLSCVKPGTGNTGYDAGCVLDIGRIVGLILLPKGTEIAFTDVATLKTAINTAILADSPYARYYPVNNLVPQADNTEDLSIQTYPDGTKVITGEGLYDWTFDLLQGKNCLASRLRKHNFASEDVLLVDQYNHLLGVNGVAANSIRGFNPTIKFALAPTPSQGNDAVTAYRYRLSFDKTQLADNLAVVDFGTDAYLRTITGLQDIALYKISRAVNVLKVGANTACGSVNLYDLYSTQLASASLWKATNANGADLTITSVAVDPNVKGWTITIDTTDPDYTAGAPINITLVGPTALNTANVKGFEANVVNVTV